MEILCLGLKEFSLRVKIFYFSAQPLSLRAPLKNLVNMLIIEILTRTFFALISERNFIFVLSALMSSAA